MILFFIISCFVFQSSSGTNLTACKSRDTIYEGTCEIFQGSPDVCHDSLTNQSIWVPPGKTQTQMFIENYQFFLPFITWSTNLATNPDLYTTQAKCLSVIAFWACSMLYESCEIDSETGVEYPKPMCRSSCENVFIICEEGFILNPTLAPLVNCSLCNDGNVEVKVNITQETGESKIHTQETECAKLMDDIICIYPLVNYGREVYNECGMTCPFPTWTEEEWDTIKGLTLGLSIVSCLATIFLIANLASTKQRRKFPNNLPIYLTLSSFGLCFSYLFEAMAGFEDVWCTEGSLCKFQGWMVMFFVLSVSTWWFSICLNIFLATIMEVQQKSSYEIYYHIYAWGLPFLLSCIFVGNDFIVYNFGENTCDIIAPVSTETPWERIWGYYVPIGVQLVIGTMMIFSVFYKILQISADWETFKKLISAQLRILLFLFVFMLIQAFFFSYHLDRTLETKDVFVSALVNLLCSSTNTNPDQCTSMKTFNFGLFVLSIISSAGQGIFFYGLFGTSVGSFKALKSKLKSTFVTPSQSEVVTRELDDKSRKLSHVK